MYAEVEIPARPTEGRPANIRSAIPPLESGDHLSASEFLRRFEAMPEIKKAELVSGIVYIASPVRFDQHGEPDALVQMWLSFYSSYTPGVRNAINSTVRLEPDDVLQPDGVLRILQEHGGQSRLDAKGYLEGAPELIVEVAASSASIDTREKLISYRRAGVREYLVWRTQDGQVDWWVFDEDEFKAIAAEDGVLRSRTFPGLWLDKAALLAGDGAKVLEAVQRGLASPEHAAFALNVKEFRPK
jgi:Uma2 family endonuclease